jgi:hypothetical protein
MFRYEGSNGSPLGALTRRLRDIPKDRLADLVLQLKEELRLITLDDKSLYAMMTRGAAEDLRDRFTGYGKRLVAYVRAAAGPT